MPKSAKPRKKLNHAKRRISGDPLALVIESNQLLREYDGGRYVQLWKINVHAAMRSVVQGTAGDDSMTTLLSAWNVTRAHCDFHKYDDAGIMDTAKDALEGLCTRGRETGRIVCYASDIAALNNLLDLHDNWLDVVTVRQMENALTYIKNNTSLAVSFPLPHIKETA